MPEHSCFVSCERPPQSATASVSIPQTVYSLACTLSRAFCYSQGVCIFVPLLEYCRQTITPVQAGFSWKTLLKESNPTPELSHSEERARTPRIFMREHKRSAHAHASAVQLPAPTHTSHLATCCELACRPQHSPGAWDSNGNKPVITLCRLLKNSVFWTVVFPENPFRTCRGGSDPLLYQDVRFRIIEYV